MDFVLFRMKLSLQRCLSNHSSFQVIDELLKFLIYQHQLTPSPVASLLHEESERREIDKKQKDNRVETAVMVRSYADVKKNQQINKCDTFVNEFLSVRDCLRNVFRSVNNGLIKEVLIGFGGNSLRIKFAYRILLAHCSKDPPCQLEALRYE